MLHVVRHGYLCTFQNRCFSLDFLRLVYSGFPMFTAPRRPRAHRERSKTAQETSKRAPRWSKKAPRLSPDPPKIPKKGKKCRRRVQTAVPAAPDGVETLPRPPPGASGSPRCVLNCPGSPPRRPKSLTVFYFWPLPRTLQKGFEIVEYCSKICPRGPQDRPIIPRRSPSSS